MPKWRLTIAKSASRDLKGLPPQVQDEIAYKHLPRIASDPYKVGKPLTGAYKGLFAYRFGHHPEYRIIYAIIEGEVRIIKIGRREDIYRR
jgi:mRNA-degrading endonuclease RelE of RelBE toxin-antitoxin system